MDFPDSTYVGSALLVEAIGIGAGTITANNVDDKITYTVTSATNIPANTKIRIQIANINNPSDPSSALTVAITTKNPGGSVIDGPSQTNVYKIKQIGTNDIADNVITTNKIAPGSVGIEDIADQSITSAAIATSFAYQREVVDGVNGWDPHSATTTFLVDDPLITSTDQRILVNLDQPGGAVCSGIMSEPNKIRIDCTSDPADGTTLRYAVFSPAEP